MLRAIVSLVVFALTVFADAAAQPHRLGDMNAAAVPGWGAVLDWWNSAQSAPCIGGACRFAAWLQQFEVAATDPEVLAVVNARVNALAYLSDVEAWGRRDRWSNPEETLARGGDCEDLATLKYFTLRALGVPADAMDIVVFRDPQSGERHAVLQVRQRGEALILDNRTDQFSRASAIGNPIVVLNDVSARFSGALFEARQNSLLQSQPRRGLWRRIINAVLS